MPLDLATLKTRLGIDPADTSKDAAIVAVAAQAQALCEAYCDRKFDYAADAEEFPEPWGALLLRRWPVDAMAAVEITDENGRAVPAQNYRVDRATGVVRGRTVSWAAGWAFGWSPLTVTYTGGLDPWPSDLTWAVTAAFDVLWAETPGGGIDPGAAAPGEVRKYSVVGAFSVESSAGAPGEVGANEGDGWGPFPASVIRGLDVWRRESRLGAG